MAARGLITGLAAAGLIIAQPALALDRAQQLAYSVRATYLVRFAAFVTWPPRAFASPSAPVAVCVAGRNPFGAMLTDAARGQTAHGRAIQVRTVSTSAQAAACHILYLAKAAPRSPRPCPPTRRCCGSRTPSSPRAPAWSTS